MPTNINLMNLWNEKYSNDDPGMTEVINYMRKVPPTFSRNNYLTRFISIVNGRKLYYKNDPVLSKFYGNVKNALQRRIGLYEKRKKEGPVSMEEFMKMVNNLEQAASRIKPINSEAHAFNSYKAGLYKPLRNYKTRGALPKNKRYAAKVINAAKFMNNYFNEPWGQGKIGLPANVNKLYRGVNNKFPIPANGIINNKSYSSWTSNKSVATRFSKSSNGLVFVMNRSNLGNIPFQWFQQFGSKDPESEYILPPIKFTIGAPYTRNGQRFVNVKSKVVRSNKRGSTRQSSPNRAGPSSRQTAAATRQAPAPRRSARLAGTANKR